jgi:8-oxo-dGTP pyrophosphatase MutT (NUDIX family)
VELLERAVVACFLRHGGRICLSKRSQAVGSAQGRWHCISGFVEPGIDPLEQAVAEIAEETGLVGDAVRLAVAGAPLRIERPSQGWVWVIHPFLFDSASSVLRLDWEHDDYRWIEPSELETSDVVPWLTAVWVVLRTEAS